MKTIRCGLESSGTDTPTRHGKTWRLGAAALGPVLAAGLLSGLAAPAFAHERPLWVRQLGTPGDDYAWGIATDGGGNVIVAGTTGGNYGDPLPFDVWVAKHDPEGQLLWRRRIGTSADDQARAVATDKRGNVFVAGWTLGSLGGPSKGDADAWLAKYDAGGRLKWKRQRGTSGYETAQAVATDSSGNVVIAGSVGLAKYDADGHLLWWRQPRTFGGYAVAVDDGGNIVIAGWASGFGSRSDASVAKYDAGGRLKWRRQLGTTDSDVANGVAVDGSGNIVITGDTYGALGGPYGGYGDAWVAKYDAEGHLVWARQIGTGEWETAQGVAVDGSGKIFVSGTATAGGLGSEQACWTSTTPMGPICGTDSSAASKELSTLQAWPRTAAAMCTLPETPMTRWPGRTAANRMLTSPSFPVTDATKVNCLRPRRGA